MNTKLKSATLAALAATAILLGGCAAGEPADTTPAPPAAVATPAAPEPQPAAAEGLKTGDVLDAATAEKLRQEFRSPAEDDAVYTTTTGERLLVRAGEPAPQFVIDDSATAAREVGAGTVDELTTDNRIVDANEAAEAQAASIGRSVALVIRIPSWSGGPEGAYSPMWGNSLPNARATTDIETQLAVVQAWVAKSPATRYYVVVDLYL